MLRARNESWIDVLSGQHAVDYVERALRLHLLEQDEGGQEKARLGDAVQAVDEQLLIFGLKDMGGEEKES